jgi:DNA-binding response OmpR family regulator
MSVVPNGRRPLILVADDEEDILTLVSFTLRRENYDLLEARDGREALQLALEQSPDLAVLDLKMPHLSGYEVMRKIREHAETTHMPVIVLSAEAQLEKIATALTEGADDYLKKPFSPDDLVARVHALLERESPLSHRRDG